MLLDNADSVVVDIEGFLSELPSPVVDISTIGVNSNTCKKDLFSTERAAWDTSIEARCDFSPRPRLVHRNGLYFFSLWQKTIYGRTLTDIKNDDDMIEFFAISLSSYITELFGSNLSLGDWGICTTPKRRHKERNFATLIANRIGDIISIPFYEDVAICRSKQRINAVFSLNSLPEASNLIIFDDFVTTGSTLGAMKNLLSPYSKNLIFVSGINNKL